VPFAPREDLILENLALRQQLLVLHAQRSRRRLTASGEPHRFANSKAVASYIEMIPGEYSSGDSACRYGQCDRALRQKSLTNANRKLINFFVCREILLGGGNIGRCPYAIKRYAACRSLAVAH
jgi:hypothetical protein